MPSVKIDGRDVDMNAVLATLKHQGLTARYDSKVGGITILGSSAVKALEGGTPSQNNKIDDLALALKAAADLVQSHSRGR